MYEMCYLYNLLDDSLSSKSKPKCVITTFYIPTLLFEVLRPIYFIVICFISNGKG